jgi:hypothetical protein
MPQQLTAVALFVGKPIDPPATAGGTDPAPRERLELY